MSRSPVAPGPDNSHQPIERKRFPNHFIFSERKDDYEPLPEPMQLKQLSGGLRQDVWDVIHEFLQGMRRERYDNYIPRRIIGYYFKEENIIKSILARIYNLPKTDIEVEYNVVITLFRSVLLEKKFDKVLDYLEILIDELLKDGSFTCNQKKIFIEKIRLLFEKHSAAYWLDTSQYPYWFIPRASQEQGEAIQEAIEMLQQGEMNNAITHFRETAKHIKMQEYEASVRESILAVESTACKIDPKLNKTLGKALISLQEEGFFPGDANPLLKQALEKLYGYANNSVRHGKPEGNTVEVSLDEAMLMYGTCTFFAAYLASLARRHQNGENRQELKRNSQ